MLARVLVTGMSGTGKSSALAQLARRGHRVVDADEDGYSESGLGIGGRREWVWREDRMAALLATDEAGVLFVAGCASNQGRFYDRFDAVVLLSAPAEVLLERVAERTTNPFGKTAAERAEILDDLREIEPLLRATCTHEIDASLPLAEVVAELAAIGCGVSRPRDA